MPVSVSEIKGVGPKTTEHLASKGIHSVGELLKAGVGSIADAPGFGQARADTVFSAAKAMKSQSPDRTSENDTVEPKLAPGVDDKTSGKQQKPKKQKKQKKQEKQKKPNNKKKSKNTRKKGKKSTKKKDKKLKSK